MTKKTLYSLGLVFCISLLYYFFVQNSQSGRESVAGVVETASRENMLLPLRAVQAFVNVRFATEHIAVSQDLLPDTMKNDPWGTPYECLVKDEKFCIHSAGPDRIMGHRPLRPSDDILIFKFFVVELSTPPPELYQMLLRFGEPLIAETLLNCDDAEYSKLAREWATEHGFSTSFGVAPNSNIW
jgi:hypothetical protein